MEDKTQQMIEWLDSHGCSNHGCDVIWTKRNIGTNAMCSCLRDMPYHHLTKAMHFHRILRDDRIEELEAEKAKIRIAFCLFWKSKGCTCCEDTESLEAHGRELAELLDIPIYDDDSGVDYWSVCEALEKNDE